MSGTLVSETNRIWLEAAKIVVSLAWPLLVGFILIYLRSPLLTLGKAITARVVQGARVKTPWLELENVKVSQQSGKVQVPRDVEEGMDENGLLKASLEQFDGNSRCVMMAHQLYLSDLGENILDVLVYVQPLAANNWLRDIDSVTYFFGFNKESTVFISKDFGKRFPVSVSAYDEFTCAARVTFKDQTSTVIHRFVDFGMAPARPEFNNIKADKDKRMLA